MVLLSYIDTSTVEWIIHWLQNMYYNPFGGDSLTSSHFGCLITLMGFMFLVISTLLSYIYSPRLDSIPPRWVLFAHGLLLFLYQQMIVVCGETFSQPICRDGNWQVDQISGLTFDAVDGKQARRTSSSSPLGELFDHGCDALAFCVLGLWEYYYVWRDYFLVLGDNSCSVLFGNMGALFHQYPYSALGADWWAQPFGKSLPFLSWVPLINGNPNKQGYAVCNNSFCYYTNKLIQLVYNVCKVVQTRKGSMLLALAMLYPFVVLVGGVLIWDYLSPYDLIGNYPHLVIVGTGFAFGFLVGRMILSHLCDEPKGLKTSMCMSLFYLPFAIANALTARLNDGVPLVDDRWVLLLYCVYTGCSLYLHFAVSVIHEITTALGIYCFRRSGGYCVCRLETSVGCGSDPSSANTSNEKKKQGTVSLPDELIFFDILTRLLVSSPAFVNLNLIQSWADHPDGFALLISVRDRCSSELVLLPASHGGDLAAHFLTLPDSTKHHSMSKNLNGLLCLHHPNRITSQLQNTFHSDNSMHICNPSTREIVKLPVNFQIPKFPVHVRLW
ncbi:unnamed protein product [Camellia sinensis]